MTIIHAISDFLYNLFEVKQGNTQQLETAIKEYYSYAGHEPEVIFNGDLITININIEKIQSHEADFNKAVRLCETGQFAKAVPILHKLIDQNPTFSEYHRNLGQAFSMMGDNEKAINSLIDALRWDPKNNYALLMLGNIFARYKNDIDTAKSFYTQAIQNNPQDHLAYNNLGSNLMQAGQMSEGIQYLQKAFAINNKYPNTNYGLALANEMQGEYFMAFDYAILCIKNCTPADEALKKMAANLAMSAAKQYLKEFTGEKDFLHYKNAVEDLCKRPIKAIQDDTIQTAAKIEYAENYNRDHHLIRYKSSYIGVYHLMMHELCHLHMATQARDVKVNMQFTTNLSQETIFLSDFSRDMEKLLNAGVPRESVKKFYTALFQGINLQLFNTPIDLFIEDRLFDLYPYLHPVQFLSLMQIINEGIKSVTDNSVTQHSPKSVLFASRVLNMVNALHFRDLFGIDLLPAFNAKPDEVKQANNLFQEFFEYRDNKEPGEEYEVVRHWGQDLKLDKYFTLIPEVTPDKPKTLDQALSDLSTDPFGTNDDSDFKQAEMHKFQKQQAEIGTNMAVVMFMVDALQYFNNMHQSKIKDIAFQIAMLGTQGINPDNKGYIVPGITGKEFSGYHLLAYYYVSWALAMPDALNQLQLPYNNEYAAAKQLFHP